VTNSLIQLSDRGGSASLITAHLLEFGFDGFSCFLFVIFISANRLLLHYQYLISYFVRLLKYLFSLQKFVGIVMIIFTVMECYTCILQVIQVFTNHSKGNFMVLFYSL
jgi:hypothetical protein